MPVTEIQKDPSTLTMTVIGQFAAPVERVWAAWTDPRQIERFWGPPEWPATFDRHDFTVGGRSAYYMTGPNGEKSRGYWEFVSVDPPHAFEVLDGFADESGAPATAIPAMRMRISFSAVDGGTRMRNVCTFASLEAMEQVLAMGMEEGIRAASNQLDGVLAA